MKTEHNYTYFAFISYKSENADWALWVRNALHGYRLPIYTRKRHVDLPHRCSPIFIDKMNLTPGALNEGLRSEVQSSQYLIVICSRKAHESSKYLDAELHYFLEGGGERSRIIPFVVEECKNAAAECFPAALEGLSREHPLEEISAWKFRKQDALLILVSRILGVSHDELRHGEARRRRKHRFFAAVLALFFLFGLYHAWAYFIPRTDYYLDYTEIYGAPAGIHKLKKAELSSMNRYYRFVSARGKVRELSYENSSGTLAVPPNLQHLNGPSRMSYEYRQDGMLSKVVCYDQYNTISRVLVYSDINTTEAVVDLTQSGEYGRGTAVSFNAVPGSNNLFEPWNMEESGNKISRYWLTFDKNGYVFEEFYIADAATNAVAFDSDGVSALIYQRDSLGRVERIFYLHYNGISGIFRPEDKVSDYYSSPGGKNGVMAVTYHYNEADDLTELSFWGLKDALITGSFGYAFCVADYDEHHRPVREDYYGPDGEPVVQNAGYSTILVTYDTHGNAIYEKYLGPEGKPVLIGAGFAGFTFTWDERGRVKTQTALDQYGKPVMVDIGFSQIEFYYDQNGRNTEQRFFDCEGKPATTVFGYSSIAWTYDEYGNRTGQVHFGQDHAPVLCQDGYASIYWKYDDEGRMTRQSFMGPEGEPLLLPDYGFAAQSWEYDAEGRKTLELYLDVEDQPVLSPLFENAGRKWLYDDENNSVLLLFLDPDLQPLCCKAGFAAQMTEYCEDNSVSVEYFMDEQGNLCVSQYNFAGKTYDSDERGYSLPIYFGIDGLPVSTTKAVSYEVSVDPYDHILRWVWLGPDGEAVEVDGSAGYSATYKADDLITLDHLQTFGKEQIPALDTFHEKRIYDMNGNLLRVQTFVKDGVPTLFNDACGIYSGVSYNYNANNLLADILYFGENGKPVLCSRGYACLHREYDGRGRIISLIYYGLNNEAILCNGYASIINEYDARGNLTKEAYFGLNGEAVFGPEGVSSVNYEYNDRGDITRISNYGIDGKPITDSRGISIQVREYDERGNLTDYWFYDAEGAPTEGTDGYAHRKISYNNTGGIIGMKTYHADGTIIQFWSS